mgnify:CR=1 FL=1
MQSDENIVYAIKIKTEEYCEDFFITKTFADAVALIKKYVKHSVYTTVAIAAVDVVLASYFNTEITHVQINYIEFAVQNT